MRRRAFVSSPLLTFTVTVAWCGSAHASSIYEGQAPWLDDRGHLYSMASLRGTPTVLTLAYGACRRVCSSSLRVMEQLQARADQRRLALNFVVVALDPVNDLPADWAQLRADRHLGRPNWQFLTGSDAAVRRLARHLGVRYWRYGEHILHDFRVVLLSPDGEVVGALDAVDQPLERLVP
jgi:protein SCO1/2